MKKYLVTEEWFEGGYTPGWAETSKLELPPNGRWLTKTDLEELYRHWVQLGYEYDEGITHVIGDSNDA